MIEAFDLNQAECLARDLHFIRTGTDPPVDLDSCRYPDRKELIQSAIRIELFMLLGVRNSVLDHKFPLIPFSQEVIDTLEIYREEMVHLFGWPMLPGLKNKNGGLILKFFLKSCNLALNKNGTVNVKKLFPDRVMTTRNGQPVRRRQPKTKPRTKKSRMEALQRGRKAKALKGRGANSGEQEGGTTVPIGAEEAAA